jgi:hypothetical protein
MWGIMKMDDIAVGEVYRASRFGHVTAIKKRVPYSHRKRDGVDVRTAWGDILTVPSKCLHPMTPPKNPAAVALGRKGGKKGGRARAEALSPERRSEIAKKAAEARWGKKAPIFRSGVELLQTEERHG